MNTSRATGAVSVRRLAPPQRPVINNLDDAIRYGTPQRGLRARLAAVRRAWQQDNTANFVRSLVDQERFDRGTLGRPIGHLWLSAFRRDGSMQDFGLVSCRVVTDTGVGFIVDAFQNLVAEAVGNTGLTTELTTQYSTANTRPTGSLGEKSGDPKTYETTATITVSAGVAATEHGIFSQAATGGGVMLDRSVFTVVNLLSAESLAATYQITFPSGG